MVIGVVNAITGNFDLPKDLPVQKLIGFDHYAHYTFNEYNLDSDISKLNLNARVQALWFKSQMHKTNEADYYCWIDGKVQVLRSDFLEQMIKALGNDHIAMIRHGARNCVYQEINFILEQIAKGSKYLSDRYKNRNLAEQARAMRLESYPENNGLTDCSIFIWHNTESMRRLMDWWWDVIKDGIHFDQTAIQFLAWKSEIPIIPVDLEPGTFKLVKHLK